MAWPWLTAVGTAIARLALYNNGTYDPSSNPRGIAQGGHIVNLPLITSDMSVVTTAVGEAALAAEGAAEAAEGFAGQAAASADRLRGTSTTNVAIGVGAKSFLTQAGKSFEGGRALRVASAANPTGAYMVGKSGSYSGTALTVDVEISIGTGSHSDWIIFVESEPGSAGTIAINEVTRLAPGSLPTVENAGAADAASLNFGLPDGAPAGLRYRWSTNAANSDPTSGKIKVSSASLTAATALYLSETDADGRSVAAMIAEWDNSTTAIKGEVRLFDPVDPANFVVYRITGPITDNGGWDTIPVEHVDHGGTLPDGLSVYIQDKRTGDKGDPGTPGVAATITIKSVATGAPGSNAAVNNAGTANAAELEITIPRGATGATGPVIARRFFYATSTTAADPGGGNFRFNNATIGSVTVLYIDLADATGANVAAWLDSFDDSTNVSSKGQLEIVAINDASVWGQFKVTGSVVDSTGYRTITLAHVASAGSWADGMAVGMVFTRSGDKGADGGGAGTVIGPVSSTVGYVPKWSNTGGTELGVGVALIAANVGLTPTGTVSAGNLQDAIAELESEKQPKDDTLTSLAGLDATAGLVEQTGADTFAKRALGVGASTSVLTRADADGRYLGLAGGTMAGALTLAGDGSSALHPISKQQFDAALMNMGRRQRVRAATTANITIATALNNGDTLDGVTLATDDLVLVKDQSAAEQNGVYVVGPSPARSSEFDTYNEYAGSLLAVDEGTANADTLWLCTSNRGGTLDTSAISFIRLFFSAYTAGAGLSLTGNQFSINFGVAYAWSAAQTFLNSSGVKILDTNASHALGLVVGSDLSADRTLTITTGDANRSITLGGNFSTGGTVTIANAFATSGAFGITLTATGTTALTLPVSGTLATTDASSLSSGTMADARLSAAATPYGKQAVPVPAGACYARTTNGAAAGTTETSTYKVMQKTFDFDTSTQEFIQFALQMPPSWNESTVTFIYEWKHATTTTNFGVAFSLAGVAMSNDDAMDAAFGTAVLVTDTGGTTNDIYTSAESSAVTIAGSPQPGDWVVFQIARVPADGGDTMAIDAGLLGIMLFITTNAGNDA